VSAPFIFPVEEPDRERSGSSFAHIRSGLPNSAHRPDGRSVRWVRGSIVRRSGAGAPACGRPGSSCGVPPLPEPASPSRPSVTIPCARGRGEPGRGRGALRERKATMAMIFMGGSRDIFELPPPAIERIGAIVATEHGVLIGDAPGADAEMQGLLVGYNYDHVGVFHAGAAPRNNLGDWAAYHIPPPDGSKGFAVHSAKDREMARRADFGLMVWDDASPGTVHTVPDWRAVLQHAGSDVRQAVEARMTADERLAREV